MKIVGIDPGVAGAIALIEKKNRADQGVFVDVADMPLLERGRTSRTPRKLINGAQVTKILKHWAPDEIYIELVSAMPPRVKKGRQQVEPCKECGHQKGGMGAVSAFNFGEGLGILEGVVAALGIRHELVTPLQWKTLVGLRGAKKEASRTLAQQLFPKAPLELVKHEGRAEALLIAQACSRAHW